MLAEQFYKEQSNAKDEMMAMMTRFQDTLRHDLERKNFELLASKENLSSSLRMAAMLQIAMLPDIQLIESEHLKCRYQIFQQASIGGDFVFLQRRLHDVMFGLFDCTGHGIPAALLATSANFILRDLTARYSSPGKILSEMSSVIYDTFKNELQSIAQLEGTLCCYNISAKKLTYCSAQGKGVMIHDNTPISLAKARLGLAHEPRTIYCDHEISVQTALKIIMHSDGLTDQFGGPNDKKFTKKRLQQLIESNIEASADELDSILKKNFNAWKGKAEQTDDMSYMIIDLYE